MSSKVVPLHQLMVHEFLLVEANIEQVKDSELKPLTGTGSLSQLKQQLKTMQVVLLRDSPDIPALHLVKPEKKRGWDSFDDKKQWALTPEATRCLPPSNAKALEQRTKLANGPISHAPQSSGNLHPPLPMPDYIPESVVNHQDPDAPLLYEYNLEIIGASQLANVGFSMDKTQTEETRYAEMPKQGHHTDSLIYKFKASVDEAKQVRCKLVHDSFNLISHIPISKLYPINSNVVVDSILFFTPAMQMDERLGLATSGYFYHFHEQQLIQEFHIQGDNSCFFSPTVSTHEYLNSTQYLQKVTNTIGVYYQLGGKPATNQHVIYLPAAITREQLDNVNEAWLLNHGIAIDVEALLAARDEAAIEDDAQINPSQSDIVKTKTHIVKSNADTSKRETWPEIASQYNLSARELLEFNPSYNDDPMRLAVGDSLVVSAPSQMQPQGVNITEPAATPKDYQCVASCSYEYQRPSFATVHDARITGSALYPLYPKYLVEETLPVARIKTLPQRTFTIGVFFDGTGQNAKNDEYKETHGDKSRTNIARLFAAYPQGDGQHDKIYVSGVGTVDNDDGDTSFIDRGEDETSLAQALGVEMMDALASKQKWLAVQPQLAAVLTEAAQQKLEKTSALYKWQSLIKQLNDILTSLVQSEHYSDITHVQFDVFGFSRGAALARHFVNAALKGIPDYDKPRTGGDGLGISPNLLGTESSDAFNPNLGYEADSSKAVSVRFVGLFDTVGSFYLPGNQDNGQFQLGLEPDCAQTVLQLTAHHEYRHNFPLTSLAKGNAPLPSNFYQEVFPGAHSDVGGGYPWQGQYSKTLLERFGTPAHSSYNRELVKTEPLVPLYQAGLGSSTFISNEQREAQWNQECLAQYQQQGCVGYDGQLAYYYRLQPINSGLCGLTQERMKQQAEIAGVKWYENRYLQPKDFEESNEMQTLSVNLLTKPVGSIDVQDWIDSVIPNSKTLIHRPHDAIISQGCATAMEWLINRPNKESNNELYREVYDNV